MNPTEWVPVRFNLPIMVSLATTVLLLSLLPPLVTSGKVTLKHENGRPQCTVYAHGGNKSDVPNILRAFELCGNSGDVIFPAEQNYWIAEKLNPRFNDVRIDWRGQWTFSDDISYWRNNSYPIAFQNHRASFILSGKGINIDGRGTGGIHGNGDRWYSAETGTTIEGRPMPFVFWNVSDVVVKNFFVNQPPFWAYNIMNGTNLEFENISCNATATEAPKRYNWVQNTDGFDTMDVNNVRLTNFVYQGGDDCIAIKPRSYNVEINNVICNGGNGIAIGSLGQYSEDASVMNVVMNNATLRPSNQLPMRYGVYIKTWMGKLVPQESYESGGQPRGGGWGSVRNILFSNFNIDRGNVAPLITQDNGNNGSYSGTSLIEVSNVAFVNLTGTLSSTTNRASISCSSVFPCYNIDFRGIELLGSGGEAMRGLCKYTESGGVHGLAGC